MTDKNARVGAILSAEDRIVQFLGYGKYVGDEIPEEAVGFMAEALKTNKITNPKIVLDSGKVVYGCECWWGSEEKVKEELAKYAKVVDVDIDQVRKEIRKQ